MKKSGDVRLKQAIYESTKGSQPRLAALGSPFQGKGLRGHSLLPMEGGAPKGRRLDGGSGMKKSEGDRLKYAIYESAATPDTKPSPRGEVASEASRIGY